MADETLDSLPVGGKLPDTLPTHPDSALAYAWALKNGGRVAAYELQGTAGSLKAVISGYWKVNAPILNPYDGKQQPSTIPPQWETAGRSAFDINNTSPSRQTWHWDKTTTPWTKVWDAPVVGDNGMVLTKDQPKWDWAPEQPAAKPNTLNKH